MTVKNVEEIEKRPGDTGCKKDPEPIEQPNILVVEGKEDERFFRALVKHMGLQKIQIISSDGKTKMRGKLGAIVKTSGFNQVTSLGVVRDADSNPDAAFQSIRDALQAAGLPAPDRPLKAVGEKPRVAVLILPGEDLPGTLEDLCLKAVAQDPAISCVRQYFECLRRNKLPLPNNMSKAKIQAFLASRHKAGLRLGEAAEAGYWPWDNEVFQRVKNFVNLIFEVRLKNGTTWSAKS